MLDVGDAGIVREPLPPGLFAPGSLSKLWMSWPHLGPGRVGREAGLPAPVHPLGAAPGSSLAVMTSRGTGSTRLGKRAGAGQSFLSSSEEMISMSSLNVMVVIVMTMGWRSS